MKLAFILVIWCMRIIQSIYSKRTSLLMPSGIRIYLNYMLVYQGIAAAFALLTLLFSWDFSGINRTSVLIAAGSGVFLTIGGVCGIKSLMGGTMVLNSVFSSAGLIVPCVLGVFVFSEKISFIQAVSIILVLVSAVILIGASKKNAGSFRMKTLVYLILSFVSNGMVMFCQKLFGMMLPNGNVAMFSMLTFLIPTAVLSVMRLFISKTNEREASFLPSGLAVCAAFQAFAVFIIQQLVTMLTPIMNSAILFTLVNGSAAIITAIVGAIMYKERITFKSAAGIMIGIAALILINGF